MYEGQKILGFIPARSDSKGLACKNTKLLLGKPLIAWTIQQARGSKYIDRVIVSTESKDIAEISEKYGADVPFLRPEELATDETKIIDVVLHAINWLEQYDCVYDLVVLLQPTSPLRISDDIDGAIRLLFLKKAMGIISVCEAEPHPYWANILPDDRNMSNFLKPEVVNKNRQELPKLYRLNGAVYLGYCDYIKMQKSFFGNDTFAYIMPKERSIDIDSIFDFEIAEYFLSKRR